MVSTMKMVDTRKTALARDGVYVNRTDRRTYSAAYKLDGVRRCSEPGVSVAGVAMMHGIVLEDHAHCSTLGAVELAAPVAITMTARPMAMRVITSAHHVLDFLFERLFHDQARRQLHQLAAITLGRPASVK